MDLNALKNIVATNPAPMAVFDQHVELIAASNQWLHAFYPQHKTFLNRYIADLKNCLMQDRTEKTEGSEILNADGTVQWIKLDVRIWLSENDENKGLIIYGETRSADEYNKDKLIEHLYQSETQFNQSFDHSLIGMALISPDGNWKKINKSLSDILGYTEAELIGRNVKAITYHDDITSNNQLLRQLSSGQIDQVRVEKRYIHKNGSVIWVNVAATMLTDSNDKPLHFISQIEDITERKYIQELLVESEKKYRTIFENVQDVFYRTDNQGRITEISPYIEKYSGFSRQELINKPVSDFYYYPEDRENITKKLMENGIVEDFEIRLKTSKNEVHHASVNAHVVFENGIMVGVEGTMRDVTVRKLQEKALLQLNKELMTANEQKIELLSIIGHDLRNPISGSLQLLNLILMDLESTSAEDLHLFLSKMKDELANTNDLLEHLLAWVKIQFTSLNFNPVAISDIHSYIKQFILTIKPLAYKKNILISSTVEAKNTLYADTEMLAVVLRNLLTNAIKFTNEGGMIDVKVTDSSTAVLFSITDNGVGMDEERSSKLFTGNNNVTSYGTSGEKGTGLGLNLCQTFTKKHGGKLWVESTPGKGSTFYFTIPKQNETLAVNENSL